VRKELAVSVGLVALTLLAYGRVALNGFIDLDDNQYVTQNSIVQAGLTWEGVQWAFTTGHSANWHPLTWLSHMLDCELFGLSPAGHHLTSLAIHLASTVLLFRLFHRTTARLGASAFVAAVFALHPLHVESVAWVAERKDVLSALFWILTSLAYVSWTEKKGAGRYALVLVLYALGLLAKPMLVTLPFVLLLMDRWPLGRAFAFVEKIPLFALAAASATVTFLVQRSAGAMSLGDWIPVDARVQNALVSYVAYLRQSIVPTGLAVYYPHPVEAYPFWKVAGAAAVILGITVLALLALKRRPWVTVGWLWFLGTLVPVIGIVQVGSQARADRYTYLPMIGLSLAVAFSAAGRAVWLLVAAVGAWTVLTCRQVEYWRNDTTLFTHVARVMPENHLAHGILGIVHLREGRLQEAILELRESIRLRESYAQGHSNLGMALELSGREEEALAQYRSATLWMPALAEAHYNLGALLHRRGRKLEAVHHYERALEIRPDFPEARNNLRLLRAVE